VSVVVSSSLSPQLTTTGRGSNKLLIYWLGGGMTPESYHNSDTGELRFCDRFVTDL
jgi:hypothetical protein